MKSENRENGPKKRTPKCLFVSHGYSTFVDTDLEILRKFMDVKVLMWRTFDWKNPKNFPIMISDALKIAAGVLKCDLVFSWFAGDFAGIAVFFSKLFGKKSAVVAGGYDVACAPEINYGQFTLNRFRRMLTKFALNNADLVLPVSHFTEGEALKWANPKKLQVIYNGVDAEKFKPKAKRRATL